MSDHRDTHDDPADDDAEGGGGSRSSQDDDRSRTAVGRAFRSTVGRESSAFGFSVMVTVTFGVAQNEQGSPDATDLLMFAIGAVMSFTLLEGVLSGGFRKTMPQHKSEVVVIGTGMNVFSVVGAVAAAMLVGQIISNDSAWAFCPFAAGLVYLAAESLEVVLGERIQKLRGDPHATEVEA